MHPGTQLWQSWMKYRWSWTHSAEPSLLPMRFLLVLIVLSRNVWICCTQVGRLACLMICSASNRPGYSQYSWGPNFRQRYGPLKNLLHDLRCQKNILQQFLWVICAAQVTGPKMGLIWTFDSLHSIPNQTYFWDLLTRRSHLHSD